MTQVSGWLSTALAFLSWHLQLCVTECVPAVLAYRSDLFVFEGETVSMSCEVQHCGQKNWTGGWGITQGGHFTLLNQSSRLHLLNHTLTANKTRLLVYIHNVNQSDSGMYQCMISFRSIISAGHLTQINVTENSRGKFRRNLYYRFLICGAVGLCLPLVLILAFCLSSDDQPAPPVPPHPRISSAARVKPKGEVMYAALVLHGPKRQPRAPAPEPIVYSSLRV